MKKGIIIIGTITILLGGSSVALASKHKVNVEGGTWSYGVGSKYVYSNYYHKSKTHKSSVIGKTTNSSGWTRKGVTSKASAQKKLSGNKSYYDVK